MLSRPLWCLCLCFLYATLCESNDAFQFLDKNINPCGSSCGKEPLGYKGFDRKSCVRGCRLFAVFEWDLDNLTAVCEKCKLACKEAYQNSDVTKEACYDGCNNALPLAEKRKKKIEEQSDIMEKHIDSFPSLFDMDDPFATISEKDDGFPVFGLDSLMNSMMNQALQSFRKLNDFIPSSRHTEIFDIIDENGEQIIILEFGAPVMNTPNPGEKKIVLNTGSAGFKTTLKDQWESNLQTNVNREWDDELSENLDNIRDSGQPCCCSWTAMKSKWWNCVRQTDCLAELALIMFWISVTFIMLIACCVPQRPEKKGLSVNGDLAFITDSKGSLPEYAKPYPAHEDAKKSPYYLASVLAISDEKLPLP